MKLMLYHLRGISNVYPCEIHKISDLATNRFFRVLSGLEYLRRGVSRCANNLNHQTVLNECRTHPERLQRGRNLVLLHRLQPEVQKRYSPYFIEWGVWLMNCTPASPTPP